MGLRNMRITKATCGTTDSQDRLERLVERVELLAVVGEAVEGVPEAALGDEFEGGTRQEVEHVNSRSIVRAVGLGSEPVAELIGDAVEHW